MTKFDLDAYMERVMPMLLGCVIVPHDPPADLRTAGFLRCQAPIDAFPAWYAHTMGPDMVFGAYAL